MSTEEANIYKSCSTGADNQRLPLVVMTWSPENVIYTLLSSVLPQRTFHPHLLGSCSRLPTFPLSFPTSDTFLFCMQGWHLTWRPVGSKWLTQSRKYIVSIFRVALFDRRWFFPPQSNYSVFGFLVFIKETWLASYYIYQMNLSLCKC